MRGLAHRAAAGICFETKCSAQKGAGSVAAVSLPQRQPRIEGYHREQMVALVVRHRLCQPFRHFLWEYRGGPVRGPKAAPFLARASSITSSLLSIFILQMFSVLKDILQLKFTYSCYLAHQHVLHGLHNRVSISRCMQITCLHARCHMYSDTFTACHLTPCVLVLDEICSIEVIQTSSSVRSLRGVSKADGA